MGPLFSLIAENPGADVWVMDRGGAHRTDHEHTRFGPVPGPQCRRRIVRRAIGVGHGGRALSEWAISVVSAHWRRQRHTLWASPAARCRMRKKRPATVYEFLHGPLGEMTSRNALATDNALSLGRQQYLFARSLSCSNIP